MAIKRRRKQDTLTTWGGSKVRTYGTVEARRDGLAYICHKIRTIAQADSYVWKDIKKHNQTKQVYFTDGGAEKLIENNI